MKKNSGFTLVELLAIIVILAIIIVVAAPNMTKQINKSEQEKKDVFNQKIENAAHLYAAKYYADELISLKNNEEIKFSLQSLVEDGLITLKDNKCDDKKNGNIIISKTSNNIQYNYESLKANDCYICQDDADCIKK